MKFTKLQAAGNDFILVEAAGINQNWAEKAAAVCDRHYGIGGDGLLLLLPSNVADFRMRVFNADGSEAEACGNGLRCFARYVIDRGLVGTGADQLSVQTEMGISQLRLKRESGELIEIQADMGAPRFGAGEIPVSVEPGRNKVDVKPILDYPLTVAGRELSLSFVSMGNPHAVYLSSQPIAAFPLSRIGPKVERHRIFPNRVNFEIASIRDRQRIEARVWERGVGETLACGSGACAIAVVARLHGYIDSRVDIKLPGGVLNVEWDGTGEVFLSGPAETVFCGEWYDKRCSQGV